MMKLSVQRAFLPPCCDNAGGRRATSQLTRTIRAARTRTNKASIIIFESAFLLALL
jgi:hypothetical protein